MSIRPTQAVVISLVTILTVGGAIEGGWLSYQLRRGRKPSAPVLTRGELLRYITFRRHCQDDKECEPPLACTADERVGGYFCLPSECETDLQCQPGFSCIRVRADPIVRLCLATGTRQEGERCQDVSPIAQESCAPGLTCMRGTCGRPCRPDDPASCPPGNACRDSGMDGYACQPNCAPGACPPGKTCVRFGAELAICGTLVSVNCDETPCGVNHICEKEMVGMKDKIAMRCVQTCAADSPCPEGYSCQSGRCLRLCQQDSDCGPHQECNLIFDLHLSFCGLSAR